MTDAKPAGTDFFSQAAATWDDQPDTVARVTHEMAALHKVAADCLRSDARVLDFGTGTGLLAVALAPLVHSVLAVDVADGMIAALRAKLERLPADVAARIEPRCQQLASPADVGGEASFDLIVSSMVFHHLPNPDEMLALFARLLRPSGRLVLFDLAATPETDEFFRHHQHGEHSHGEHAHAHSHEHGEHSHGEHAHAHSHSHGEHSHGEHAHAHSHEHGEHSHGDHAHAHAHSHEHSHGEHSHAHSHEHGEHSQCRHHGQHDHHDAHAAPHPAHGAASAEELQRLGVHHSHGYSFEMMAPRFGAVGLHDFRAESYFTFKHGKTQHEFPIITLVGQRQ